jgi:hypothetical protein
LSVFTTVPRYLNELLVQAAHLLRLSGYVGLIFWYNIDIWLLISLVNYLKSVICSVSLVTSSH